MSKLTLIGFMLPLLLLFAAPDANSKNSTARKQTTGESGTLQKMIVENGVVTIDLDLDRLIADGSLAAKMVQQRFAIAANSFFSLLVFNDLLRGAEHGSMVLVPQYSTALPAPLMASINQLALEKLQSSEQFDLAVRDAKSGFTFFNIDRNQYDYDAKGQLLSIQGGRLLISKEFADALGRPADADSAVGKITVSATVRPIEVTQLVNGEVKSVVMPPLRGVAGERPTAAMGPDVIVGDMPDMEQFGSAGTQVGLAVATTSCNNGTQPLHWFASPDNDHPVIPQNLYRMSGGTNNNERFEQIGQSSCKHAFLALEGNACGFGCNTSGCTTGSNLCPGCSDPYSANLNSGPNLGSRAWINPFTGFYPRGDSGTPPNNHSGHAHNGVSHRILVEVDDLNTTLNAGASYFAEAQYVTPHEYTWCQAHPTECNMYNNASWRQFMVTGTTSFSFSALGATVRTQPAIMAWVAAGATVTQIQPDPGNDGFGLLGYKVTNPEPGVWHYEYALYNQNLDRAIQSFSVPLGAGINVSNIGFHAPPQHPAWANDGTLNSQGYSSTTWIATQAGNSITWNTETFAQNQNANAIRWGTLYNFRFDADQPPQSSSATVGFFKTGSPIMAAIQGPTGGTPTPTPTASSTPTPTATATATSTATATPTFTATATPTSTPRPSPTARPSPVGRPRPTPAPRP